MVMPLNNYAGEGGACVVPLRVDGEIVHVNCWWQRDPTLYAWRVFLQTPDGVTRSTPFTDIDVTRCERPSEFLFAVIESFQRAREFGVDWLGRDGLPYASD
jgi:hypothetical protein